MADKWTVMIYMGGDNNLSEEMVWSLKEMKHAGSVKGINVLAQFDPGGLGVPTQRYVMKNCVDGYGSLQTCREKPPKGKRFAETNTGAPGALKDFISWGMREHKADHYMVVLSGHGSGADEDFLLKDQNPPDSLSISELHKVFSSTRKIDVVGFDSCLMSMLEVCSVFGSNVGYVVGAEGFEPQTGWPYREILTGLMGRPDMEAKQLTELIVSEYAAYYADYASTAGVSVDLSACDLNKMKQVKAALNGFSGALVKALDMEAVKDAIVLAHWEAQTYKYDQYTDLRDFCGLLQRRCAHIANATNGKLKSACEQIVKACIELDSAIHSAAFATDHRGAAFQFSKGLSIYFPWAEVSPRYNALYAELNLEEKGWPRFLERYVACTRYLVRDKPQAASLGPAHPAPAAPGQPRIKVLLSPERIQAGDTFALTTKYSYNRYSYNRYSYDRYSYNRDSVSRKFMVKNPPNETHCEPSAKGQLMDRKAG